ncbi:LysR family transcriptional regulator [Piscinibacter sp. HJYY11]|uniref:LysR family transcriptional regulator n=1 Tax=Piscinibacter sp. HJYY11 TaxID=2801333 RepID=UPI0019203770|nr:LysR family transcriptional regulator [Piscinibacter sp. HJYY11]MBL0730358.1 LysR family transcriptional regulator [Piscinibacter sp. HJYY11]
MDGLTFDDLKLFARVASLGTLSAVARERDVPVSQVSRTVARIEKTTGVKLMHRSTHALALTPEGETFLDYCHRITGSLDELEGEFNAKSREASGLVRVAASTVMAQYRVLPSLPGLHARHPRVQVELEVSDRLADLTRDGIDIALRTTSGPLPETVVARQIGTHGRALYATAAYLEQMGTPQHPDELARHRLVTNSAATNLNLWPFIVDGQPMAVPARGFWRANDTAVVADMVLMGLGIGRLSTIAAGPLVKEGRLVPVMPECVDEQPSPVYAVTAGTRHRLPKIKACIDYWVEWFAG